MYGLENRAMLATLNVTTWSARKTDKARAAQIAGDTGAALDAASVSKHLLSKASLGEVTTAAGNIRALFYHFTLPWNDSGQRIMPTAMFIEASQKIGDAIRDYLDLIDNKFIPAYQDFLAYGYDQQRMGSMHDASDYPSADKVRSKFTASIKLLPFPDVADFRVDLADDMVDHMRNDMQTQISSALSASTADCWERLYDSVSRMAERLTAYAPATRDTKAAGIFRDSIVENCRELCRIMPSLNVQKDPNLESLRQEIERKLCQRDASQLRESDSERATQATDAALIARKMSAFMGPTCDQAA